MPQDPRLDSAYRQSIPETPSVSRSRSGEVSSNKYRGEIRGGIVLALYLDNLSTELQDQDENLPTQIARLSLEGNEVQDMVSWNLAITQTACIIKVLEK